jgi:nitroimidazol reductase NimA-like FMN-containing flavoprotein (pyridoxamine 5'-phosphate oxidase superfamily)
MVSMDTTQPPTPVPDHEHVHITTPHESWQLLREAVVGRLAVISEGAPDIFPVNFAVDHGSVVIRTAGGTKHEAAHKRQVAFEVDGYDLDTAEAWSVVLKGRAVEVYDVDEAIEVLHLPLIPWAHGSKPHLLRLVPRDITGRRFKVAGGARRT